MCSANLLYCLNSWSVKGGRAGAAGSSRMVSAAAAAAAAAVASACPAASFWLDGSWSIVEEDMFAVIKLCAV